MAQLDIAKKRVPQDGRFSLNLGQRAIDVRVSTPALPPRRTAGDADFGTRSIPPRPARARYGGRCFKSLRGRPYLVPTASSLSQGRPVRVKPPRSMQACPSLMMAHAISSPSKTLSNMRWTVSAKTQVNSQIGMTFAAGASGYIAPRPRRGHGRRNPRS